MHQNRWRLGSAPDLAGGAYNAPPDPLAVRGEGRVGDGEGEGREGEFAISPLYLNFLATPLSGICKINNNYLLFPFLQLT